MKFAFIQVLSVLGSTAAFVHHPAVARAKLSLSVLAEPEAEAVIAEEAATEPAILDSVQVAAPVAAAAPKVDPRSQLKPGRYDDLSYSLVLPFWDRPSKLDGSHAGDFGFDPLGFTENNDVYYLQECELRHARLAMLAVAGWPLSELLAPSFMLQDGRAPSVLNGVNPASGLFILGAFAAFGYFETVTALRKTDNTLIGKKHANDMALIWKWGVAGDYNWDPANLYNSLGDDAAGRKGLREVEVMQGRYAMVAITYFAVWEALTRSPIVENNMFFHPNTLLPLIGVAHGIWSQFYQVSDLRKYPIQIEYTKDGEEMLRGAGRSTEGIAGSLASVVSAAGLITSKFGDLTNMVLEKVQTNSEEK